MSKKAARYAPLVWGFVSFAVAITGLVLLGLIYADVHTMKNTEVNGTSTSLKSTNCSGRGTTLTAEKTAATHEIQIDTYMWNVTKSSATQLTIIPRGECGFLPPISVDAVRTLSTRSFKTIINGTVTITNGGAVPTTDLIINDILQVQSDCTGGGYVNLYSFIIDVSMHPVLQPGETWVYYYEIDTALVPGYNAQCGYRNTALITITNHAGWIPGCPGNCPGPEECPFGPGANGGGVKADVLPSNGVTVVEIHEEAVINDQVACPAGFNCTSLPGGDISIPTPDVCSFDGTFAHCDIMIYVCNINVSCDTNLTMSDYVQLITQNEVTPLVVSSNMVTHPIYTGPCTNGCTLTIGYWKTHAGFTGNNADRVTQYLPITLGCPPPQYAKGANVTSNVQSTAILTFNALFGGASNGLNKVAAQLLASKLNIANGATAPSAVVTSMNNANTLLCQYGFNPGSWSSLSNSVKNNINSVASSLDKYNNGLAGVAHCL
jgi:hypothetical protein